MEWMRGSLAVVWLVVGLMAGCVAAHTGEHDDSPPFEPGDAENPGFSTAIPTNRVPAAGSDSGVGLLDASGLDAGELDASGLDATAVDGSDRAAASPGPGVSDAGAASDATPADASSGPSCTITAHTDATGGMYSGRHGCAVWIADSAKRLVKTLFLATRIAGHTRLPDYPRNPASAVDVVTAATLREPKHHSYTWDLRDLDGGSVPPGVYTLNVETHCSAGDSGLPAISWVTVPFDTSMLPLTQSGVPDGAIRAANVTCR